jgi:SAM-dependent methyltransferase
LFSHRGWVDHSAFGNGPAARRFDQEPMEFCYALCTEGHQQRDRYRQVSAGDLRGFLVEEHDGSEAKQTQISQTAGRTLLMGSAYRERIYGAYVSGRAAALAPETVEGLAPRRHHLRRIIREHFPANRGASILELGCGHGALLHFAREAGYTDLRGIDGSPEQVAAAKRLGVPGVEQGGVLETLAALPDGSQDCIVAYDVIEHFARDELIDLVDQVRRVLKANGRWIIHTPNAESPFGMRMRYWDLTHELAFTRTSIAQLLMASGFTEVRCFEDYPEPYSPTRFVRWVVWKLIRGGLRLYLAAETGDLSGTAIFSQNFLTVAFKGQP